MTRLDPHALFALLAREIPAELHPHLFLTGSLAAAYQFADQLQNQAVSTKDADLVVHPAGDVHSCRQMADRLRELGWRPTFKARFRPQPAPEPTNELPVVRMNPPDSNEYFIEFLTLPLIGQEESVSYVPIKLPDGWYAVPSFRYFALLGLHKHQSTEGLEYADPAMMALVGHPP
jgi:hypothetical protein